VLSGAAGQRRRLQLDRQLSLGVATKRLQDAALGCAIVVTGAPPNLARGVGNGVRAFSRQLSDYKAGGDLIATALEAGGDGIRARDEQDFLAPLPTLTDAQRGSLRESIATVYPAHPWLRRLVAEGRARVPVRVGTTDWAVGR
jgi:hypothetical protein